MKLQIRQEEFDKIVALVKQYKGVQLSVAKYAALAGYNSNRTRFIFDELLEQGKIIKVEKKRYNSRYIRYCYYPGEV